MMNQRKLLLAILWTLLTTTGLTLHASDHKYEPLFEEAESETSHIAAHHSLIGFTPNRDVILEDESIWKIEPSGKQKVCQWTSSHTILVKQSKIGATYRYVLSNVSLSNQTVGAEILATPIKDNPHTLQIAEMWKDPYTEDRWLRLSDGSLWNINENEEDAWKNWYEGDYVLIGTNNIPYLLKCCYPLNIIINFSCSRRNFITSQCKIK